MSPRCGEWGAFNGPPGFAMGSHSAVTSFRSTAEFRRESNLLTPQLIARGYNDTLLRKGTSNIVFGYREKYMSLATNLRTSSTDYTHTEKYLKI